tara:strand:+ start:10193 stop:11971 length:1779 start_codon:yes stop_codon:yes gene_type:complete
VNIFNKKSGNREARIVRRSNNQLPALTFGMPDFLEKIFYSRGIRSQDDIELPLKALLPISSLKNVMPAAKLIAKSLLENKKILFVGDFDADGASSCAFAVLALKSMGYSNIDFMVPNRFEFGYGLTPKIIEIAKDKNPNLIITVDNGISSLDGVDAANKEGIEVIITDHHLPGSRLPNAAVIVNPNQDKDSFASKSLAGVGVIFYVIVALKSHLTANGWFKKLGLKAPKIVNLLDLVALGTIADLVPLDKNNRILVKHGLNLIKNGKGNLGILALLQISGRDYKKVTTSDIGFAVGPRLNAAGRLADMSLGIRCLLSEDYDSALEIAVKLDSLNRDRKDIEEDMKRKSDDILSSLELSKGKLPYGICVYDKSWHQGVIGILASRIKENYHRPTIVFSPGDNSQLKGSARSINGFHIKDALDRLATLHPNLLKKFGGHAMAAGMTINKENFQEFVEAFDSTVKELLLGYDLEPKIVSDGPIPINQLTIETAFAIRRGGPWGQAFQEPKFDDTFIVQNYKKLKERHWKLSLRHESNSKLFEAIAFNMVEIWPILPEKARFLYRLDINDWNDKNSLQLIIEHIELNNEIKERECS